MTSLHTEPHPALRHVASTSTTTTTPISPFPGERIEAVPVSTVLDTITAVVHAREAQANWSHTTLAHRAEILNRYHDLVLERQDLLLDVIQRETGKARGHAMEEIFHVAMIARFYATDGRAALKHDSRAGAIPVFTDVEVHHQPKGVVGIISPWNYPFSLAICDALPAVMAGNAVVLKPDLQTLWSALHAVDLLVEAGLPEGVVTVVVGDGPDIGGALIDEVDYVCFTGSTATGRRVAAQVASRLIGMSLELGGKNPMIVCADANLEKFLDIAVRSCFTSAGQLCVSTERMFVAREIYPQFLAALVERTRSLTLGASLGWGYDVGSLTTAAHAGRVQAAIARAIEEGAKVVTGGTLRTDIGPLVFEPTVLTGVSPTMSVAVDEVFGPCVVVTPFDSVDEAISMANDSEYGLSASVITSDLVLGSRIAEQIRCGSVNVNESYAAAFGSVSSPMGGMSQSGYGRRHGAEGILRFTEPQTIAIQRGLTISPHFGRTDSQWAGIMTKALNLMKKLWIR